MALIREQRGVYDVIIPSLGSSGKVAKETHLPEALFVTGQTQELPVTLK
jgi:hypothetical protein